MAEKTFEVDAKEIITAAKLLSVACAMTEAEVMKQDIKQLSGPGMPPTDWTVVVYRTGSLEGIVRDVLEANDGLCMDVPDERARLAKAIAKAL